jgi:hypothetical protein
MNLTTEIPSWTIALFAIAFWSVQYGMKRFVRLWALITLPATALHELAHALVGLSLAAQPSSFNLWPKRVGATAWRLGYVAFNRLRWWNGGAVALAPLIWLLVMVFLVRFVPSLPSMITLQNALLLGVGSIWLWIAVAPSRSDWRLALEYWFSALVFLSIWGTAIYALSAPWLQAAWGGDK